jgi:hypothetical protein
MKLSDDLFFAICKALAVAPPPSSATDDGKRRRAMRLQVRLPVEIEPFGKLGGARRQATLADLSCRGIALIDDRTWAAGQKLVVYLPRASVEHVSLVCTVRNARLAGAGFRIGAEFTDQSEMPEEAFVPSAEGVFQCTTAMDRGAAMNHAGRKSHRMQFGGASAPAQLHTYRGSDTGPIVEAEIVDLSDSGVGLLCGTALSDGQTFAVRLCPPGGKTLTRMCIVTSCRPVDADRFRIGARFIPTPQPQPHRTMAQVLMGWFRGNGGTPAA